jgi:hypothetical protein
MTIWQRRDDWLGSQVDDQYVMINLESGRYIALNPTAAETWQILEVPHERDDLVAALVERFKVDTDECARSIDGLLARMAELQLVQEAG